MVVEDSPSHIVSPALAAFWWASASGPRHPDMRGKAQWVQLGSWYPSSTQNRSAVLKADPMAEFFDLEADQPDPNNWNLRLAPANEIVTVEVRSSTAQTPSAASQPGYMSVPLSGRSAGYFTVDTYLGHVHRFARGVWRATGTGVFSDALSVPVKIKHSIPCSKKAGHRGLACIPSRPSRGEAQPFAQADPLRQGPLAARTAVACCPCRPAEIQRIYVDQQWHGRGVAQALMSQAFSAAGLGNADQVWLGVWENNPRALAFYRKLGFKEVGDHVFQLGSDPQRDWILCCDVRSWRSGV